MLAGPLNQLSSGAVIALMVLLSDRWHCRFSKADTCEKKWAGLVDLQQIALLAFIVCSALTNNIIVKRADVMDHTSKEAGWHDNHKLDGGND